MIFLICTLEPTKIAWLPQFVAHYRNIGVDAFLLTLQQEPDADVATRKSNQARFEATSAELSVDHVFALNETYDSSALRRHHHKLQDRFVAADDWVVWCDSDEFQIYPNPLGEVVSSCEAAGIHALQGILIDRVAADGSLPPFDPAQSVWKVFSRCCNVTDRLAGGENGKIVLTRGALRVGIGNHRLEFPDSSMRAAGRIEIHHFKWHSGVIAGLQFRLRPEWRAKCFWWIESARMVAYFVKNNNRFNLLDIPEIEANCEGCGKTLFQRN